MFCFADLHKNELIINNVEVTTGKLNHDLIVGFIFHFCIFKIHLRNDNWQCQIAQLSSIIALIVDWPLIDFSVLVQNPTMTQI